MLPSENSDLVWIHVFCDTMCVRVLLYPDSGSKTAFKGFDMSLHKIQWRIFFSGDSHVVSFS